jgi:16S rRNA (adenine(1408)-N(1))-methyltransferase
MAETSRRASRAGLSNAVFVVASAERVPPELHALASELTIAFPWGSLLRGTLAVDDAAAAGIAALLEPDGHATATLSIEDRDGLDLPDLGDVGAREALRDRWSRHGLQLSELRRSTPEELASMSSTWARRLGAGRERVAWRLELRPLADTRPEHARATTSRVARP